MKAFLMYRDRDFDLQGTLLPQAETLIQDLELNILFNTMSLGDKFLFNVAKVAVLSDESDLDTISYRQSILKDCLKNSSIIREIYQIPIESIENKQRRWYGIFSTSPSSILYGSVRMLQMLMGLLKKLKNITDLHSDKFESDGFKRFFSMIKQELNDEYFAIVQNQLQELEFQDGVLVSAELGKGNIGINYILRKHGGKRESWLKRMVDKIRALIASPHAYTFYIADRDVNGFRAISELNDRGINLVANALAQSADHIDNFFNMLRIELAFYLGCLNLHKKLWKIGEPVSYPQPVAPDERRHSFAGLYDICLALTIKQKIVGNDVNADSKDFIVVTGANQGGKSTFLRSIGLAQLMMQCGMFVPAENFYANICRRIFTHFKRKEDVTMKSGKLDEELGRMSNIVDNLRANSILLFNESFAATNEREGSEIARQITRALLDKHIKVFYVTHLYDFALSYYDPERENALFLRAERKSDGERTYKLIEGKPLQTSYGDDLYTDIFGIEAVKL